VFVTGLCLTAQQIVIGHGVDTGDIKISSTKNQEKGTGDGGYFYKFAAGTEKYILEGSMCATRSPQL
jgi:hypothetical protein